MKKVFAILMCLVMVMTFMPAMAWAGKVSTAPQEGVTYQENTLYCISSRGATCENGIITVTDYDAVSESVTLELNWNQKLYFAKLNENDELQAVDVEVSVGTEEPCIDIYIEQTIEDGVKTPYCYTVWANNIGSGNIKEATENGLVIPVQVQLPVFGAYYNKTVSEDSFMFTDIGFSYLRDGNGLSENEIFYVALKQDAVETRDDLELIITYADEIIKSGIIAGEMTTSADGQYYIWPISVSDQFRNVEQNNSVYITLYRGEDEICWDCYNIYDSQTIPEENQLVWVEMSDEKYIDDDGYINSEDERFDYFEDILGVVGDTLGPICFGDYIWYDDATKVVYPTAKTFDNYTIFEIEGKEGYYNVTFTNPGETVLQVEDEEAGKSYLMFITVLEAINKVGIEDLITPVKNGTPDTEVNVKFDDKSAPDGYKPTVEWFEGDQLFKGDKFLGGVQYTVQITLPWPDGSGFPDAVKAEGFETGFDDENNLVLTKTFAATDPRTLSLLKVTSEPTKKAYTHGDSFDTDGMVVKGTYDDGTVDEDFRNYEVVYATEGQKYLKYNDQKVVIKSGSVTAEVTGITVGQKQLFITGLTAANREYDGTKNVTLSGGQLAGVVVGENVTVTMPKEGAVTDANAGTAKPVIITKPDLTGTDAENYTLADITGVTVNINKKNIEGAVITLEEAPTYNGSEQSVAITNVELNGTELNSSTDYDVTGNTATNVGDTTLTITGKGNYTGTATKTWSLSKATPTAADFNLPTLTGKTYTGKPISVDAPTTTKTGMGTVTVKYDGSKDSPVDVKTGGYNVTFDVTEGQNYNAATGLEIGKLNINKAKITVAAKNQEIYVDGTVPDLASPEKDKQYTVTGLADGDALGGTIVMKYQKDGKDIEPDAKSTGTYEIVISGGTAPNTGNYEEQIIIKNGTLTIKTRSYAGGGGLPVAPTEKPATDPTQSGNTTTTDMSGSTESKGGQTTTTVDKQVADKLVETAVANKSEEIVISTVTKNQSVASSIKSSEVALPAETLQTIADKTNANIVIKTDVAEVKLDNKAAEAVASQAQAGTAGKNETVSIVAEKVKEEAKEVRFELKVVTSSGEVISDFNGGNVSVTVNVPKSLSNKNIVCVYIDENGYMHKMDGRLNSDGTYSFTTGHFSTYAIMSEEEVDAAIKEQKAAVKSIKLRLRSQLVKTKSGKKAIKLTWTNPSDIEFEGVEIYRSLKKNTGYGKKPIYISKSGKYINTAVKSGKKYYYRVRAFVTIDGEKVYTEYSGKAYRTVK